MDTTKIPQHVAFICDGNSRWAHRRGLDTRHGHVQGADRLVQLLEQLKEDRISYCTLYGFSTENWRRPTEEIQEIFGVMEATARTLLPRLLQGGTGSSIRIRILGDLHDERIPRGLRMILQELQRITDQHKQKENDLTNDKAHILTVCLAINYGGRQDIVHATKKLVAAIQAGELSLQDLDKNDTTFASYLSTAGIPDPDLIVRTSGEHRLSNFLLWNSAYSEFYVTDTLWPDFDIESWHGALEWYQQRSRRFGSRDSGSTEM
jgi:undecaprenyl diphosphate synthase